MIAPRYRLAHPLSVLWRAEGVLQLGLDADAAVLLRHAPVAADAALRALRVPRTVLEVTRLVPGPSRGWVDETLRHLLGAGLVVEVRTTPARRVVVVGEGILADAVHEVLAGEGVQADHSPGGQPVGPGTLAIVCGETVEPDRVWLRELTASGTAHLVVRAEPERAVVGPFVDPGGGSACLGCTDLVRRDLDAGWPHLLAQLCRTRHTATRAQAAWVAAMASAQAASWFAGLAPEATGVTLELDTLTHRLGGRRWPAHPDCACALAAA